MTKAGQTTNMTVSDHVCELTRYIGKTPDHILVNGTPLPADLRDRYAAEGEYPVVCDYAHMPVKPTIMDLLATEEIERKPGDVLKRSLIRHDSEKLGAAIIALFS